jgi:predicted dienelactone hydrolase
MSVNRQLSIVVNAAKRRWLSRQHLRGWTLHRSLLGWLLLGLCATTHSVSAAERIYASYAVLERSISVAALEVYAKEGKIEEDLAVYARYATPDTLEQLRKILLTPAEIEPAVLSQFLYTRQGEVLLKRLGEVIQPGSGESGFYGLRAALILSAADRSGLSLLNVLRQFPTPEIRINLARALAMAEELQGLVNQSRKAAAVVVQLSALEAQLDSDRPLPSSIEVLASGRQRWETRSLQLVDTRTQQDGSFKSRVLDVDVYLPQNPVEQPPKTIVISHGLGSDRTTFAYLAEHYASHGFAVIVPQHPGSDARQLEALISGTAQEVSQASEFLDRPKDITFILDELEELAANSPDWTNRLNLEQVGAIGQSFGGYTVLALAGATLNFEQLQADCDNGQEEKSWNVSLLLQCRAYDLPHDTPPLRDDRIEAVMALNPITSSVFGQAGMSQIQVPVTIVGGSADTIAPALVEQILPFTALKAPDKYLVLLQNGTHFSALGESEANEGVVLPLPAEAIGPNPSIGRRYTRALSLAFFQTYIGQKIEYRSFLTAKYARSISQDVMPLDLIQFLDRVQLSEILEN